ncbi:MAG: hypothetical protein HEQ22_09720 [Sphingopyxis sp.]|uniref:hypothetical protein n=1 Tax=Sphingopyxis sp. TaxID=1908224 RepID=UPI003D80FF67
MDSDHVNIRRLIRAHDARQVTIARLNAPDDWQSELRTALAAHREPVSIFAGSDLKLFLQSFAVFFTATMMFLI